MKQKRQKKYTFSIKGFTLVETFVAMTILVMAAMGPLGLLGRSISDGLYAKNELVASYLAQEGAEMVINLRNQYRERCKDDPFSCVGGDILSPTSGTYPAVDYSPKKVYLYGNDITLAPCDLSNGDCAVRLHNNEYVQDDNGSPTIFNRTIKLEQVGGNFLAPSTNSRLVRVTSTVHWKNKLMSRRFSIVSYIFVRP